MENHLALLVQGDRLLHGGADPDKLPHFIKGPTEARCRWEASKPTPGRVPLFTAAVILFQLSVEILIPVMENVLAKDCADGTWVRTVSIRDHSLWSLATCLEGLLEKALGSVHSAFLTEHGINQMAILLDGTRHGAPLSLDPHVGFSNVPGHPRWSATPPPHLLSDHRSKSGLPIAHGFLRQRQTTFQEQLGQIT